jgi:hypothetical protein
MDEIMRMLTQKEVQQVSGGSVGDEDKPTRHRMEGAMSFGAVAAIGAATFGGTWGAAAVAVSFAAAPIAVVAMAGLAAYGAYSVVRSIRG